VAGFGLALIVPVGGVVSATGVVAQIFVEEFQVVPEQHSEEAGA